MSKVNVIVLRTAGTNCDKETAFAFEAAGARAELVHINEVVRRENGFDAYHILAIPGGFTYGDDIASGKILANELKFKLQRELRKFISSGRLIIGICNGFQILVKSGLLPNLSGDFQTIEATLTLNDSDKFEDRWVYLKRTTNACPPKLQRRRDERRLPAEAKTGSTHTKAKAGTTKCVWTKGIDGVIELPVAHGEGKFIPRDKKILSRLKAEGLIVFEYVDEKGSRKGYPYNPNGSVENIAGICDHSGRIFGLMPHPERHISFYQHPRWTGIKLKGGRKKGDGFIIFENGVEFAKKHL